MTLPESTLNYLLSFLLGRENNGCVVYSANPDDWHGCRVAILPSGFFDQPTLPERPACYVDRVPVLFGSEQIETIGRVTVLHADVVASAFFLLSRYDEYCRPGGVDRHSRFLASHSFLGRNNLLSIPVVDQYRELLLRLIGEPETDRRTEIYLTHDVDTVTHYRRLRGFLGGCWRCLCGSDERLGIIVRSLFRLESDPAYTFPVFRRCDARIAEAHRIYFVKTAKSPARLDRPFYSLRSRDFLTLSDLPLGLHSTYHTRTEPDTLPGQMEALRSIPGDCITTWHRAHYLRVLPPEQMHLYAEAGITDDFTLAYAEQAGFRLGTARAVRCIDPATGSLVPLTLHPLTIMDATLSAPHYMGLTYRHALATALRLVDTTVRYHGDICLLWHNTSLNTSSYHEQLYNNVISHLCEL